MPINYSTLVKSEKDLHKMFCDYFKHINNMQAYLLNNIKEEEPLSAEVYKSIQEQEEASNKWEATILDETSWMLSKDNPRGTHLRYCLAITRSIKDLERMGDFAFEIASLFRNDKDLHKKVRKSISRVLARSCAICQKYYEHIAAQTKDTKKFYVSTATPLMKDFGAFYQNAFKELAEIIFSKKIMATNLRAFTCIKYVDRNTDHANNILQNFIYIKEPDFYFKKPETK